MRLYAVIGILIAIVLSAGCSPKTLSIDNVWARPANMGGSGAVYFVVENASSQPDTLLSASSEIAENVELHMSMIQEDSTMTMVHQNSVTIPANDTIEFKPGGLHVMLINLNRDLTPGDKFAITLKFQNTGDIDLEAEVREP